MKSQPNLSGNTLPRQRALALSIHLLFCGAATALLTPAATHAAELAARSYAIAPGPLGDVLALFAASSGVKLSFDPALVAGQRSAGLQGSFTVNQGFSRILSGSGFELVGVDNGVYTLRKSPSTAAATLQPVVVTGTKRELSTQQATQSVAVITEQSTIGMASGFDALTLVPNVTRSYAGALPTVRGLDGNGVAFGGGGAVTGASPRVSNYIDGVARTYSAMPDGQGSFWDMAQMEVYRGSQSTQLGQNSIAGAIVQTTNDPKFKDEAAIQVGAHSARTTYEGAFMVNKALSDTVAIRFTGELRDGKNAIDYLRSSDSGLSVSDKDELGKNRYHRYRFKALATPTDALLLKLTLEQEDRENPFTNDQGTVQGSRALINKLYPGFLKSINNVVAFNASYDLNNEWSVDAVLSQQRGETSFLAPQVGTPVRSSYYDFTFKSTETAFEPKLRYKSQSSRTGAVFGAYFKDRDRNDNGQPGSSFVMQATDKASSQSLYADSTVQLNAEWDLILAGRFESDRQKRDFSTPAFGGAQFGFDDRNQVFLPKLGVTWHANPNAAYSLLTYKGYNASGGGVSFVSKTPYKFQKEMSQTVEFVARTQWLDRRLFANANVFFTDLDGAQAIGTGPGGANDNIYLNIDKARTRGAELDFAYIPTSTMKLTFGLGLLDTKIVNFGSTANNVHNGKELGMAPRVTANVGANVEVAPNLTVGGNVVYVGKRFADYKNVAQDELASYSIVNLNTQYKMGKATLTGYVNNAFDKFAQLNRNTALNSAWFNTGRTVGAKLKLDF